MTARNDVRTILTVDDDARAKLLRGVDAIAGAVAATAGPGGRLVCLQKPLASTWTKDGHSVAQAIHLVDDVEDLGAEACRRAAAASVDAAADGTTTTTILLAALVRQGFRLMSAGFSAPELVRQIEDGVRVVLDELRKQAKPVTSLDELRRVALVSANGDSDIADVAARAVWAVGVDGKVVCEPGPLFSVEKQTTFVFPRGLALTDMAQQNGAAQVANGAIAVSTARFTTMSDVRGLIAGAKKLSKPLVVIGDVGSEALDTLRANGAIVIASASREDMVDVAVATGATLITAESTRASLLDESYLGAADLLVASMSKTAIAGGKPNEAAMSKHVGVLEAAGDDAKPRLLNLRGQIATVRLKSATAAAYSEAKDRFDDAVGAARCALRSGVVAGAGAALVRAAAALDPREHRLLTTAARAPLLKIASNAGFGELICEQTLSEPRGRLFDVRAREWVDAHKAGIVDPLAVVEAALKNAVSYACLLLSTQVAVTEVEPS